MKDSCSFVYKALLKELYVVNIYLRTYNDKPDFEIGEPEAVYAALLGFISSLVHNQGAVVLDDQDILNLEGSPSNTSEVQTDIVDRSITVQNVSGNSLVVSDGKAKTSEKFRTG